MWVILQIYYLRATPGSMSPSQLVVSRICFPGDAKTEGGETPRVRSSRAAALRRALSPGSLARPTPVPLLAFHWWAAGGGREGRRASAGLVCLRRARGSPPSLRLFCSFDFRRSRVRRADPLLLTTPAPPAMKLAPAAHRTPGYGALRGFRCHRCGSQRRKVTGLPGHRRVFTGPIVGAAALWAAMGRKETSACLRRGCDVYKPRLRRLSLPNHILLARLLPRIIGWGELPPFRLHQKSA